MLCDRCKKNEATFHVKEVVGKKMVALDLCKKCASAQGLSAPDKAVPLDLATLIYNLTAQALKSVQEESADVVTAAEDAAAESLLVCPECGCREADFKETGRLGCQTCYAVFNDAVRALLKGMHRGTHHVGKALVSGAGEAQSSAEPLPVNRLAGMREELARAIATEAYERAAELRDQIGREAAALE